MTADKVKRLKPLKIRVFSRMHLNSVIELEEMLIKHQNLTSQIEITVNQVDFKSHDDDRNLVEDMMQANRINPDTYPIMHEYFAKKKFHEIWMNEWMHGWMDG